MVAPLREPTAPVPLPLGPRRPVMPSLSQPLTSLVGRDEETAALRNLILVERERLVTLTGPGGVGKTRLALRVIEELAGGFADGAVFVPLAAVADPGLVPATIARELGVHESGDRPVLVSLIGLLRDRTLLLVLDNFEQVLPAASAVSELLAACPKLVVVCTSRAALHLSGECEFPVPPLALPSKAPAAKEASTESEAVRLFALRARAVNPGFAITLETAPIVAAICRRLDGLPLAIELAAARTKILSPPALLARLEGRLDLLAHGPRDLPARQRTMRDAVAWSYDLLGDAERALFRRLSVFVGGFTLEAAEPVATLGEQQTADTFEEVAALVDHSLVRLAEAPDGEPRFELLETIRAFGLERLAESGEEVATRNAHAAYFLAAASDACDTFEGSERSLATARVALEHDNLRAALAWAVESGDAETAQQLATHLARFWVVLGAVNEGRAWLDRAVALNGPSAVATRVDALCWAAQFASHQNAIERAELLAGEALTIAREHGYDRGEAMAVHQLGQVAHRRGDLVSAATRYEEAVIGFRRLDEPIWVGVSLRDLGVVAGAQDEHDRATAYHEEALAMWRRLDHPWGVPAALRDLADEMLCRGDVAAAVPLYRESLGRWRLLGEKLHVAGALLGPATVALEAGQAELATQLLGASAALHEAIGAFPPSHLPGSLGNGPERARAALGETAFEKAWVAGRALSVDEAITVALTVAAPQGAPPATVGQDLGLTPRELEVLRLLVDGRPNRDIAEELSISPRTVGKHIEGILAKLGVETRTAAVGYALRHHVV